MIAAALLFAASGCVTPTQPSGISDTDATSCGVSGPGTIFPTPGPDFRSVTPAVIRVDVGNPGATIGACFFRDKERPAERAAIQWTSMDPAVATVSPATGPATRVTAVARGRTTLTAVITGVPVVALVRVCDQDICPAS